MNILEQYRVLNIGFNETCKKYDEGIEILNRGKHNFMLEYNLELLNNVAFKKKLLNKYIGNVDKLCCDIIMINSIKVAYKRQNHGYEYLKLGYESEDGPEHYYDYSMEETKEFNIVYNKMIDVFNETIEDTSYSDSCLLRYQMPDNTFFDLIYSEYDYDEGYKEVFMIKKAFYPIILKLEELINSNSEKFIKMIEDKYV